MKSTLWPCLVAMMLALGASACSESSKPSNQTACDPACGDGLVCNEVSGQCVGCLTNADCSAPASQCRMSDFVCVSCLTDSDCLLGYECNQTRGTCEEGEEPVECDATHPCDGADEECVAGRCVVDVDCTPEDEVFTCPGSECTADGVCLNQKQVPCRDAAPAYATNLDATVTITWTAETQWSTPKACEWRCDDGFTLTSDGTACETTVTTECTMANQATTCPNGGECTAAGTCLTSKLVACTDAAPSNATSREEQVSITWTANGGWSAPKNCQWSCDDGFERSADGKACVAIATTECTAANQATTCPNGGECTAAGTCRTSKSVQCADAAPSNATSTVTNVTIAWDAATGWDTPATCAWTCDDGFQKTADGKACEYSCMAGTCSDNAYCNSQHKLQSCGGNVCVADRGCMEPTCTASSGCTATFETCNTSANSGLGECVPATCSSSTCSGDYACQGGKWTECAHGCASGSCKAAPVGCAAKADPDDWCMNNDANPLCDLNTGNCVECLVDGDCGTDQECASNTCRDLCGNGIVDRDQGEECDPNAATSAWENAGKCPGSQIGTPTCDADICLLDTASCTSCGNGKLDGEEICDPSVPQNQWASGYRSCEDMSYGYQVGTVACSATCEYSSDCTICGNGRLDEGEECDPTVDKTEWDFADCAAIDSDYTGELTCEAKRNTDSGVLLCEINMDQCVGNVCAPYTADEECTSYSGGPQPCDVFFDDFSGGMNGNATIVCKAASAECTDKLVIDEDATLEACMPLEPETKAVDWCRLQSHGGSFDVTLDATTPSVDFYGQVYVNGVTGTNGSGSNNIRGQFVYWDLEGNNMKTIDATKTNLDAGSGGDVNDQWVANVSVADFAADDMYIYSWRFSADNGASWYFCKNERQNNGSGGATTSSSEVIDEENALYVTKPATTTYTENWTGLSASGYVSSGTFESQDVSGLTWSYSGSAVLEHAATTSAVSKGILMNKADTRFLKATMSSGVGTMTIKWGRGGANTNSRAVEVFVSTNGGTTENSVCSSSSITGSTEVQSFTCNVNASSGSVITIRPKGTGSPQVIVGQISWTSYP